MRRDALLPVQEWDRRMSEMDGAILRSLDRVLGLLVQSTWQDLARKVEIDRDPLDYSGIFPIGAPQLAPFLDQPGLFLVFGPLPEVRILHLGASQTAMREVLQSKLIPGAERSPGWRWESESNPIPAFVACAAMERDWTLAPALKILLGQYIAPLRSIYGTGVGKETLFF